MEKRYCSEYPISNAHHRLYSYLRLCKVYLLFHSVPQSQRTNRETRCQPFLFINSALSFVGDISISGSWTHHYYRITICLTGFTVLIALRVCALWNRSVSILVSLVLLGSLSPVTWVYDILCCTTIQSWTEAGNPLVHIPPSSVCE